LGKAASLCSPFSGGIAGLVGPAQMLMGTLKHKRRAPFQPQSQKPRGGRQRK